jgi:hypothetical protein
VSTRVAVFGDAGDLALAGVSAGEASTWIWSGEAAGAGAGSEGVELVVSLGSATRPTHFAGAWVRWLDGSAQPAGATGSAAGAQATAPSQARAVDAPEPDGPPFRRVGTGVGASDGARLIAQAGSALWRRAPWPVDDSLFALPAPAPSAPVLVVGPEEATRDAVEVLDAYGVSGTAVQRLTRTALQGSVAVIEIAAPGAPAPALLMAPLAARRVLLRVGAAPDFGLQAGVDHLAVPEVPQAAALCAALLDQPRAFDLVRAFGAITAARHRASVVYARLLADVRLERAATAGGPDVLAAPS